MARTGPELDGFLAAARLLLDEEAYLAWTQGHGEETLPIEMRRELADFLTVVGGDGRFHGTLDAKRAAVGDGHGWVAPADLDDDGEVPKWHAVGTVDGESAMSACGTADLQLADAVPVADISPSVTRCATPACQKRLVL